MTQPSFDDSRLPPSDPVYGQVPPPWTPPSYGATPSYGPPPPPPPQQGWYPPAYQPVQTNSMAIVALISALVMAPLGIVFGHIALSQIKKSGEEGRGLAMAGLIIGYVMTGITLVFIFFWLAFFVWFASRVDTYPSYEPYSMGVATSLSTPAQS